MISAVLLFLFFCSGVSGLIYQVIWVREFGNVFGNTVYSTSLVLAIFMLGLGAGGYAAGIWADRRYAAAPDSLLRSYAVAELIIAALGLGVSLVLPHLTSVSAQLSSYGRDASGWFVVSTVSYMARGAIALVLLSPITLLMGGTLTLLIRHLVRGNVEAIGGWRIALLYAVNTVAFHYARHPILVARDRLVRIYVVNLTEFDPVNSIHIHGNFFNVFRTGTRLEPSEFTDTIMLCQAERAVLEMRFPYAGQFMFHAHQTEFTELGWMGLFEVTADGSV